MERDRQRFIVGQEQNQEDLERDDEPEELQEVSKTYAVDLHLPDRRPTAQFCVRFVLCSPVGPKPTVTTTRYEAAQLYVR